MLYTIGKSVNSSFKWAINRLIWSRGGHVTATTVTAKTAKFSQKIDYLLRNFTGLKLVLRISSLDFWIPCRKKIFRTFFFVSLIVLAPPTHSIFCVSYFSYTPLKRPLFSVFRVFCLTVARLDQTGITTGITEECAFEWAIDRLFRPWFGPVPTLWPFFSFFVIKSLRDLVSLRLIAQMNADDEFSTNPKQIFEKKSQKKVRAVWKNRVFTLFFIRRPKLRKIVKNRKKS